MADKGEFNLTRRKHDGLDQLNRIPACALVVGPAGLPGEWGRREVDEAAHRKSRDPAFRFLLVYLPDAGGKLTSRDLGDGPAGARERPVMRSGASTVPAGCASSSGTTSGVFAARCQAYSWSSRAS